MLEFSDIQSNCCVLNEATGSSLNEKKANLSEMVSTLYMHEHSGAVRSKDKTYQAKIEQLKSNIERDKQALLELSDDSLFFNSRKTL